MTDQYVYRVRVPSDGWAGGPGLNTHYFMVDPTGLEGSLAEAQDCADRVRSAWYAMRSIFPTLWTATVDPSVDIINTDNGNLTGSLTVTPPAAIAGETTALFGPSPAVLCANLLTGDVLDARRVRGRAFVGPLYAGTDANGTPQEGPRGIAQAALAALQIPGAGSPAGCVWSRRRDPSLSHPAGLGGSAHPITGVTIRDSFAVLTSRRS